MQIKENILKNNLVLIVILISTLLSCNFEKEKHKEWLQNEEKYIEYYENGNIKKVIQYNNNLFLKNKNDYEKMGNGKVILYYPNGNVKEKGQLKNGVSYGEYIYYDENNKIRAKRNFILLYNANNSYLNEEIFFDKKGDTIKNKGNYFTFYVPDNSSDTIVLGNKITFSIELTCPIIKDSMYVITGDFDNFYNIKDSSSLVMWTGSDLFVTCEDKSKKIGENSILGVIYNFNGSQFREQFFKFDYFVKGK
jgi:hypothetical protein